MPKEYQVAVIVPVYKVEKFVERGVRSLLEQSLASIQYIFVDDHGRDDSMKIIRDTVATYPERLADVLYLTTEKNSGAATARNVGLAQVNAQYTAFCDADDWIEKDAFERLYTHAIKEDLDIVWSDFVFDTTAGEQVCKQDFDTSNDSCIRNLLMENMHGALWNKLYKSDMFRHHGISFLDGYDLWEDLNANVRLFFYAKKIGYLPAAFYHYIQYNTNSLVTGISEKKIKDMLVNTDFIISFLTQNRPGFFDKEIMFLKLAAKKTLLFSLDIESFKSWRRLYAEANPYIMSFKKLPLHLRFLGWASANGVWPVVRLYIQAKKLKTR
ncbi:glycosyltransferase family 2 protein [Sphingobacterium sp. Mn56C]|uniref:glycosyltransferase family 2 protein n=1 Tax=Sphingobacterium sp. Mn56C TaxID=3395261 RepID=UPI003BD07D9A